MSSDDMFKTYNTNPYDPADASTGPVFRYSFDDENAPSGVMRGWKRIIVLGCILAFMLMPLYLEF